MHDFFSHGPSETLRVLIVDDDKDTVDSLAVLVHMWGYEVHKAYDAAEALASAQAFPPDVVFLDIGLPKVDGFHLAERLLALNRGDMQIIAVSGYTDLESRLHADLVGIHEYLIKPVDPARLEVLLALRSECLGRNLLVLAH